MYNQNTIILPLLAYGVVMVRAHTAYFKREIKYRNRINQRLARYPDTRVHQEKAMSTEVTEDKAEEKPRWFSLPWWKGIFTAFMFWKYSARDLAVSTVSTINTTAQLTFGGWVKLKWASMILPALKATWGLVVALFAAVKAVILGTAA